MSDYLYNGHEFPDWDENAYPYAFIADVQRDALDTSYVSKLFAVDKQGYMIIRDDPITEEQDYLYTLGGVPDDLSEGNQDKILFGCVWELENGAWVSPWESQLNLGVANKGILWSNHTILWEDGSVYMEASDPIPVEPEEPNDPPVEEKKNFCLRSWLIGFALGLAGKPLWR